MTSYRPYTPKDRLNGQYNSAQVTDFRAKAMAAIEAASRQVMHPPTYQPIQTVPMIRFQHQPVYHQTSNNFIQLNPVPFPHKQMRHPFQEVDQALCLSIRDDIIRHLITRATNSNCSSSSNESIPTPEPSPGPSPDKGRGKKRLSTGDEEVDNKRRRSSIDGQMVSIRTEPQVSPEPIGSPTESFTKNTQYMLQYYKDHHQNAKVYSNKLKLREALFAVMKGVFPYSGLYIVGSSMNGFGTTTSDMDLCLMVSHEPIDQRGEAKEILKLLQKAFGHLTFLRSMTLISAKVPILRFWDKYTDVECDLNINNSVGIRNTHLLNNYSRMDWRVRPLMLFVKHWARVYNINDAREGTISSYSLGLMVIHYLQAACDPPVLPCLQRMYPMKFSMKTDIRNLTLNENVPMFNSLNQESLSELFEGFLDYYAFQFRFERDAISVRVGTTILRQEVMKNYFDPTVWKHICIEEPFDMSNTARSVYDYQRFQYIRSVFRNCRRRMQRTRSIENLITHPNQ